MGSATAGAIAWIAILLWPAMQQAETVQSIEPSTGALVRALLLLGPLVVIPLGLAAAGSRDPRAPDDRRGRPPWSYRAIAFAQPFAAAMVVASMTMPPGARAAMWAAPWLGLTALVALYGLVRALPRGVPRLEESAIDIGLLYLPIGGAWLFAARWGFRPYQFSDGIVLLTAVHFHFAGFAAPILVGLTGRVARDASPRAYRIAAIAAMTTPPLVAAGILLNPTVEAISASLLAAGLLTLSFVVAFRAVPRVQSRVARALLLVSAGSLVITMAFAFAFALGERLGVVIVDIRLMAHVHGVANALGFASCGLVGWTIVRPAARGATRGIPLSRLAAYGRVGGDWLARKGVIARDRSAHGLVDDFATFARDDFDPDSIHPEVRRFYEHTLEYRLVVTARWRRGLHLLARIYRFVFDRVEQLCLPLEGSSDSSDDAGMTSEIVPVDEARDGRPSVRAWIRAYEATGKTMFVACYGQHTSRGVTYMNIALPIPLGNVSGVLRLDPAKVDDAAGGALTITSIARAEGEGDEGIYFANALLPIRLPLDETFTVWATPGDRPSLRARHAMRLFGVWCVWLDYRIERIESSNAQ